MPYGRKPKRKYNEKLAYTKSGAATPEMTAYLAKKDREREGRGLHGRTAGPRVVDDDTLVGAYGSGLDILRSRGQRKKRGR